jgi:hypothetical protein
LQQNNPNGPDYKTASTLLDDLTVKVAELAKTQAAQKAAAPTAQAGQQNSALQNPNLPNVNVNGLNTPPQPSTPSAVKANPRAKLPQTNAATTPVVAPAQ